MYFIVLYDTIVAQRRQSMAMSDLDWCIIRWLMCMQIYYLPDHYSWFLNMVKEKICSWRFMVLDFSTGMQSLNFQFKMWCDVKWREVTWCDVMWCDMMWCDLMLWYIYSFFFLKSKTNKKKLTFGIMIKIIVRP